jgi:hypothetical protein
MLHSCRRVPFLPKLYEELLRAPYDKHIAADIEADRIRNISMAASEGFLLFSGREE